MLGWCGGRGPIECAQSGQVPLPHAPLRAVHVQVVRLVVRRRWPDDDIVLLAESFWGLVALTLLAQGARGVRRVIFVACTGEPPRPLSTGSSPVPPGN